MKYNIWRWIMMLSALLSGCTVHFPSFNVPDNIDFNGNRYQKVTDTSLDKMRQLLYLPINSDQNPEQWQQGFLIFLDRDLFGKTLYERAILRENVYQKQPETQAKIAVIDNELRSEILYPPTERFHNVQLEVSRGKNFDCGFGQMQFSDKRSVFTKNLPDLTAYQPQLKQFAQQLASLTWQMECKK